MKSTLLEQLAAMTPTDEPETKPEPNSGQPKPKPEPKGHFDCPECGAGFSHAPTLKEHMEAEHPDTLQPEGKWECSGQEEQEQEFDRIIRHTEKATLFGINDRCFWLPKSKYRTFAKKVFAPEWLQITLKRIKTR